MPEAIDGHELVRVLGEGATATVYEARQPFLNRPVALKVLKTPLVSPFVYRRFEKEIEALRRLNDPGIADVYAAAISKQGAVPCAYIVMEYVKDARTLVRYAAQEQLLLWDRTALFLKVCQAVHHGHQQRVLHCDLKPANILVDRQGNVKVVDFGIAKILSEDGTGRSSSTVTLAARGTPPYTSPEQLDAAPLDQRTDVYSLGIILYELLCGIPPFKVWNREPAYCRRVIDTETPPRPSVVNQALRGEPERIILKAMAKDKADRYPSALELATDIERLLDRQPAEGWGPISVQSRGPCTEYVEQVRAVRGARAVDRKEKCTVSNPHYERDRKILERGDYDLTLVFSAKTVFIVTGSRPDIELLDRPIAEMLRDAIDRHGNLDDGCRAVVVSDAWHLDDDTWSDNPCVSVGGPNANDFTSEITGHAQKNKLAKKSFMAQDGVRVALWGQDTSDGSQSCRGIHRDTIGHVAERAMAALEPACVGAGGTVA